VAVEMRQKKEKRKNEMFSLQFSSLCKSESLAIYIYSLSHRRNLQEHELWNMSTEIINNRSSYSRSFLTIRDPYLPLL